MFMSRVIVVAVRRLRLSLNRIRDRILSMSMITSSGAMCATAIIITTICTIGIVIDRVVFRIRIGLLFVWRGNDLLVAIILR